MEIALTVVIWLIGILFVLLTISSAFDPESTWGSRQ